MTSKTTPKQRAELREVCRPDSIYELEHHVGAGYDPRLEIAIPQLLDDLEAAEKALAESEKALIGAWNIVENTWDNACPRRPYRKFVQYCLDYQEETTS